MSQLIPFDAQVAAELDEKLSATMFRSTADFIQFYNSGLVNKAADEVVGFANEVDAAFKNVQLQGRNLVFISKSEVELDELLTELKKWEIMVKVKDRLSHLVASGEVDGSTRVEFATGATGVLQTAGDEDNESVRLFDEKFFRPSHEPLVADIHSERSSVEGPGLVFAVSDFTSLDDSFISTIYAQVFKA